MLLRNLAYGASAAALLLSATAVHAQETTGGIVGGVYDAAGAPVVGATVVVTHIPSGTSVTTLSGPNGNFGARNLRVGGPYAVRVSSAEGEAAANVAAIGIGSPYTLDLTLVGAASDDAFSLSDVVVTGARSTRNTSPTSNFNLSDVETLPSISRDIKDIVRTSPFATVDPSNSGALSIGGQNTRYNAFLVDGVRQGDDFGLNNNGYPTVGTPISLSVIEAVSVSVSPYDVQYGSFTGGVINSVTKSGGNEFHGEVFKEWTNDGLQGNTFSFENFQNGVVDNRELGGTFEEETWGATLSGPIIKDRLFFLVNYENFESTQPVLTGPTGSDAANPVPGITQADVDAVRSAVQTRYGYDPLDWQADALTVNDEKWFAKLDWNINDRHRAVLSYQSVETGDFRVGSSSTSNSTPVLGLLSSGYLYSQTLESIKGQIFSDWTDTFSTEFSVAKKSVESLSQNFVDNDTAQFLVYLDDPASTGTRRAIRLGPDISRQANELAVDTTFYRAVANWDLPDDHRLTFGYEREEQDIFNVFVQNANGTYEFASVADLAAGQASSVVYQNAASNVKADAGAAFSYAQNTLFVQDTWRGIENLTLTAGIRLDWYEQDDRPLENPAFEARYGFKNNENLDGIFQVQPRFGFNWRAADSLSIYGGFGRYQGGSPNVWISNAFSNTGNLAGLYSCRAPGYTSPTQSNAFLQVCPTDALTDVNATQPSTGLQTGVTNSANRGTGDINPIDPSFKTPSIWKTSLGATYGFDLSRWGMGDDWTVTGEYVHSEQDTAVGWIDLSMVETQNGTAPDGRPTFDPNPSNSSQRVLLLTNFEGGQTDQFAVSIGKDWRDGWAEGLGANLSYTYLDSTESSSPGSSTASSSFQNTVTSDPNSAFVLTSSFEIQEAWKLNLSYQRAFFGDYRTRLNLFGQKRSGLPFSYVFNSSTNSMFGVTSAYSTRNQLLYVPQVDSNGLVTPTSDPLVQFGSVTSGGVTTPFDLAGFNDFLQNTGLIKYAGQIAPRNAFRAPDVTTFDLHIAQEIPAFFPGGARLEIYADVENLGNLLNDEWGVIQQYNSPYASSANVDAVNCNRTSSGCPSGTGNYYSFTRFSAANPSPATSASVWQVKFGVRYTF